MMLQEIKQAYNIILTVRQLKILTSIFLLNKQYPDKTRSVNHTTHKRIMELAKEETSYVSSVLNVLEHKHNCIVSTRYNSHAFALGIYNTYGINKKGSAVLQHNKQIIFDAKENNATTSYYEDILSTTRNSIANHTCGSSFSI